MPEGPEVRLERDQVAEVLLNQVIDKAWFLFPHLNRHASQLAGAKVLSVETRGKAMLTRFDNGLTLYSHNQLYGRWLTAARKCLPVTNRSLRAALYTENAAALLYSASDIELLTAPEVEAHPYLCSIGPDVLDPELHARDVAERLKLPEFNGRSLAALYLDQKFLAGIGNYLRSEILFTARVNPTAKPRSLDKRSIGRLARQTLTVSRRSYATRGVTVTSALARSLRRRGQDYKHYRFWVYGREALPCRRCGEAVARFRLSSRSVFFCPVCQGGLSPSD